MAFSETEKVKILRYIGWPPTTIVSTSLDYSKIVSDRLTNASTPTQGIVRELLDRIENLDEKLDKAICRAGVKQIDDITLRDNEIDILRKERRKIFREIALLVNIKMMGSGMMGAVCV